MENSTHYEIFMDGSCSFCQWARSKIEPYDSTHRLRFLSIGDPQVLAQAPFSSVELYREMHVHTPDGSWKKGFEAWLAVIALLPKLAWIGRIASIPPIRWLGPSLYRFVARHRYRIPGVPARCDSDTCALAEPQSAKLPQHPKHDASH